MSGMESLKDVTLRPWPKSQKEELGHQDLLLQIEQLAAERGHLRDVTEKSLQEAIRAGKDISDDVKDGSAQKKTEQKAPSKQERLEKVHAAQREMHGHLDWSIFAATNALDLISLVLSQDPGKRNPTAFSHTFREQGLNQGIPYGSFGISRENHEYHSHRPDELQKTEEVTQRQNLVAQGSRMEALDTSVDEILKAAKKLEKEVRRETKYWKEIVSVSDKGWPIQRLRQNTRHVPFGVRFGLPEASDHFKARGFAPLQMDKDGSIILDPALALKPKMFRVRVSVNGTIAGTSQVILRGDIKNVPIEKSIQSARDSLFEEELYYEMSLETRQLQPYGVEFRDSVISVDALQTGSGLQHRKLLIDCVPRDEPIASGQEHTHDWLAQNVAEALRFLLAHEHSMRLHRRSQLPPPLSARQQEKLPPPLLRTLLAVLRHLEGVDSLYVYLDVVAKVLDCAGLGTSLETTREASWAKLADGLKKTSSKGLSAVNQLFEIFTKPFDGKATLSLPTVTGMQPESVTIDTRTIIGQPTFGTEHKLTVPSSLISDLGLFPQLKFSSVEEVKSYLDWVLSLHIAHRLLRSEYGSRAVIKSRDSRIAIVTKSSKKDSSASTDVAVELHQGILKVTAIGVNVSDGTETAEQEYIWNGGKSGPSLREIVKRWVE